MTEMEKMVWASAYAASYLTEVRQRPMCVYHNGMRSDPEKLEFQERCAHLAAEHASIAVMAMRAVCGREDANRGITASDIRAEVQREL